MKKRKIKRKCKEKGRKVNVKVGKIKEKRLRGVNIDVTVYEKKFNFIRGGVENVAIDTCYRYEEF
jgi:hypothetical protein